MTKQNKNIVLLLIGVILLFSFTKAPKKKGSIIIEPLQGNNLYANKLAQLYDGLDPSLLYYTFLTIFMSANQPLLINIIPLLLNIIMIL